MSIQKKKKQDLILQHGKNFKDTGKIEVQISLLTDRINYLQEHFSKHANDHGSRRGLLNLVSHRRKLLSHLKNKSISRYSVIIEHLNLRR